jgi:hypothetical protein
MYGKIGLSYFTANYAGTTSGSDYDNTETSTELALGGGFAYDFNKFALRFDYTQNVKEDANNALATGYVPAMISLDFIYKLG